MIHNKQKSAGIGLLELMLSLGVIAVLLVMATIFFKPASQSQKVSEAISHIQAIDSAANRWSLTHANFNDVDSHFNVFINFGLLPAYFADDYINPWGGNITVDKAQDILLQIKMDQIPAAACKDLTFKLQSLLCEDQTATCDDNSTITIPLYHPCPKIK